MKAKGRGKDGVEGSSCLGRITEKTWGSKGVWFWPCLLSANAMYMLLESKLGSIPADGGRDGVVQVLVCGFGGKEGCG